MFCLFQPKWQNKKYKADRCYLQDGFTEYCNVLINGKNFYDQPTDSDIKRHKEIRRLKISQDDDWKTVCNSTNRLCWTAKRFWWFKYWWYTIRVSLNNFWKNQRSKTNVFTRKRSSLIKMRNCEEIKVKLTNIQLNKLKSAAKKKNKNNTKNNKEKKSIRRTTSWVVFDNKAKNQNKQCFHQ